MYSNTVAGKGGMLKSGGPGCWNNISHCSLWRWHTLSTTLLSHPAVKLLTEADGLGGLVHLRKVRLDLILAFLLKFTLGGMI